MKNNKLTAKQIRFCEEYIITNNGAGSAVKAGYKAKNARITAHKMLKLTHIQKKLAELSFEVNEASAIPQARLIIQLESIAFGANSEVKDQLRALDLLANIRKLTGSAVTNVNVTTNVERARSYRKTLQSLIDRGTGIVCEEFTLPANDDDMVTLLGEALGE